MTDYRLLIDIHHKDGITDVISPIIDNLMGNNND